MIDQRAVEFVFFDIGGTLGDRDTATGTFSLYPSSRRLLEDVRDRLGLRMGVITTLGAMSDADLIALLRDAGLDLPRFLDPQGFVSDHIAPAAKPDPAIYRFAAERVGVPIERCLFVGENLMEVMGALTAGMKAVLKPCPPGRDVPV